MAKACSRLGFLWHPVSCSNSLSTNHWHLTTYAHMMRQLHIVHFSHRNIKVFYRIMVLKQLVVHINLIGMILIVFTIFFKQMCQTFSGSVFSNMTICNFSSSNTIISTKKVMFSSRIVCWLSAELHKNYSIVLHKTWVEDGSLPRIVPINFWWGSYKRTDPGHFFSHFL